MPQDKIRPDTGATRYTYDTTQIGERERFDYYREILGQKVLRYTPERPTDGTISVSVDGVSLENNIAVSRVELSPHLVRRTVTDLLRSNQDLYHLGLNYGGALYRNIGGECIQRKQNGLYFGDSSIESEYVIGGTHTKLLCITFPKELIRQHMRLDLDNGIDITPTLKTSAIFKSVGLLKRRLSTASFNEINAITSAIISLLTASLIEDADEAEVVGGDNSSNEGVLMLAKEEIERSLALEVLSPTFVAASLGISVRLLQKAFENNGLTFHRYVVAKRLDSIRDDLLSNESGDKMIMDVAKKWGISDATTLHRNYKSRFDETPHQTRLLFKDTIK